MVRVLVVLLCVGWLPRLTHAQGSDSAAVAPSPPAAAPSLLGPDGAFRGRVTYQVTVRHAGTQAATLKRDSAQHLGSQVTEVLGPAIRQSTLGGLYRSTALRTAQGQHYVLDSVARTAWSTPGWSDTLRVVPQAGRDRILGMPVQLYHIESVPTAGRRSTVWQQVWATDSLPIAAVAGLPPARAGVFPGIRGLPLRVVIQEASTIVTLEVVSISADVPPASRLEVPAGWTTKPWDPVAALGGMGGDRNLDANGMPRGTRGGERD